MERLLSDDELLSREQDLKALRRAYDLLQTDQPEGFARLSAMADQGSVMAKLYIASRFKQKGGGDSVLQAEEWYQRAFKDHSVNAVINLAGIYIGQKEYHKAEQILLSGANRDDAPSMSWLASLYLDVGIFAGKKAIARSLLERAIAQEQYRAMQRLAVILLKERKSFKDVWRALGLYRNIIVGGFRTASRSLNDRRLW